jgi:transketolase
LEINGHDISKIIGALKKANDHERQPTIIILNTTKGKGVSFMENNVDFHGVPPNEMERNLAIDELDQAQKRLEAVL